MIDYPTALNISDFKFINSAACYVYEMKNYFKEFALFNGFIMKQTKDYFEMFNSFYSLRL